MSLVTSRLMEAGRTEGVTAREPRPDPTTTHPSGTGMISASISHPDRVQDKWGALVIKGAHDAVGWGRLCRILGFPHLVVLPSTA